MTSCTKCGEVFSPVASDTRGYCPMCVNRLGLELRGTSAVLVYPSSRDFYERQLHEPVLSNWLSFINFLDSEENRNGRYTPNP